MAGRFSVKAVFSAVDKMTAPISRMQNRVNKMTESINSGFNSINKTINGVGSSLASFSGTVLKAGAVAVGALTASVTLLVREFSKVEDAVAAFTPLLGGANNAQKAVDLLNKTAASTPFQFETLSSAANTLLGFGAATLDDLIPTLRMLGDTAGGSSDKLGRIALAFSKVRAAGKADMQDLNQLIDAGIPIFGVLEKITGKTTIGLREMSSQGKISADLINKAFLRMTQTAKGKFFKGMEIASKTTSGLMSTLKDNISLTAAELGGVLAPTIKEIIISATDASKRVREWVKNNRDLIETRFIRFVDSAKVAIQSVVDTLSKMNKETSLLERLGQILIDIADAFAFIRKHGESILAITKWVLIAVVAFKSLVAILTIVNLVAAANPFGLMVIGIMAAVGAFGVLFNWIDDVIDKIDELPLALKIAMAPFQVLLRTMKFVKDTMKGGMQFAFDELKSSFIAEDKVKAMIEPSLLPEALRPVSAIENQDFSLLRPANDDEAPIAPQVVSPSERITRSFEQRETLNRSEITIKDETGRAEVTKGSKSDGIQLQRSGAM